MCVCARVRARVCVCVRTRIRLEEGCHSKLAKWGVNVLRQMSCLQWAQHTEYFTSSFRKVCVWVHVYIRAHLAAIANHRLSFSFSSDSWKRQKVPKRLRETLNCLHCCSGICVCECVLACVCIKENVRVFALEVRCTECNCLIIFSNHL